MLGLGPVYHLWASTTNQTTKINIGPKKTTTVQFMASGVKSLPETVGKHKKGTIVATNATEKKPIGRENLPKFQGPGLKVFCA